MTLKKLQEKRESLMNDNESLFAATDDNGQTRDLTADEKTKIADNQKEIDKLDRDIETAKLVEKSRKQAAEKSIKQQRKSEEDKLQEAFSFTRAVRAAIPGGKLEGAELEAHQEAELEAKRNHQTIVGVGIPASMIRSQHTVADSASAGNLVQTQLLGYQKPFRNELTVEAMGATVMRGLTSNLALSIGTQDAEVFWGGEVTEDKETKISTKLVDFSPKRLGATTQISKQLLVQASIDVERIVKESLDFATNSAIDKAAIAGVKAEDGSFIIPGILNTDGVTVQPMAANGEAMTMTKVIDMEALLNIANANMGKVGYLATAKVKAALKKQLADNLLGWDRDTLNGYHAMMSNHLPTDLKQGTLTKAHSMIFGNFNDLFVGNWGGLDLVADPYSKKKSSLLELTVNSFWNILVKNPQSFVVNKGIKIA